MSRGILTISTYSFLVPEEQRNKEDSFKVNVLGWCIELVSCHLCVQNWRKTFAVETFFIIFSFSPLL